MKKGKIIKNRKGKLIVKESEKGRTFSLGKYSLSNEYINKECEFRTEGTYVSKLIVDGKEIPIAPQEPHQERANPRREFSTHDFYEPSKIKAPKLTKKVLESNRNFLPDNFFLRLQKFSRWEFDRGDNEKKRNWKAGETRNRSKSNRKDRKEKPFFYRNGKKSIEFAPKFNISENALKKISKNTQEIIESFKSLGYKIEDFELRTTWRMVIGLGSPSIYETSLTLHHIYGVPYIPGSAIKGVTRNYKIIRDFNGNEKEAEGEDEFVKFFGKGGDKGQKGEAIFLDAYPSERPGLEVDIMNPHYREYYEKLKPPADYLSPVPIPFLTLRSKFRFLVLSRKLSEDEISRLVVLLKEALAEEGIGAKTAIGYGIMESPEFT